MLERQIEAALIARVKDLGGEVRKVQWIGRASAPDRLVMLPDWEPSPGNRYSRTLWVEVKNPDTIKTFPADARERAQHREHERMRRLGQHVEVIGTLEQIERLFS
jgi:hypothetical protein